MDNVHNVDSWCDALGRRKSSMYYSNGGTPNCIIHIMETVGVMH